MLLKARRPEKYKERQSHEHSGPNGGPIQVANMTDDELDARLMELLGAKGGRDKA